MTHNTTLIFEAVGMELSELAGLSCRIRTRFKAGDGQIIYLELSGLLKHSHSPTSIKELPFNEIGIVDHALLYQGSPEETNWPQKIDVFHYTQKGIVDLVNTHFGTQFQALRLDESIWVHDPSTPVFC